MVKKSYKVQGMHCTSCAMLIESDLEDVGIKACCSYAKQTLDIEFNENEANEEKVKTIVKTLGYELE